MGAYPCCPASRASATRISPSNTNSEAVGYVKPTLHQEFFIVA